MRYNAFKNKDAQDTFVDALAAAGHTITPEYAKADFMFYDSESVGKRREIKETFEKPRFIWPHTPTTYWLWDGVYEPLPVKCNFVASEGAKEAMLSYGYKYPVEVVGFSRCEVKPFTPTEGLDLLFVPSRPRQRLDMEDYNDAALEWIIAHREYFDKVTMYATTGKPSAKCVANDIDFHIDEITKTSKPTGRMLKRIARHDLVIAMDTVASLAVASGKPTIFYAQDRKPDTIAGVQPKNYDKYDDIYRFPLTLEYMDIEEVLAVRETAHAGVELWKARNIGSNFDADLFVNTVEAHL